MVAEESAKSANGLISSGASELSLSLKMDEEVEDLSRIELGGFLLRKVLIELDNPSEIRLNSAFL